MRKIWLNEIRATFLLALGILIVASLISFTPDDLSFYTSHPNVPCQNLIRGFGAHLAGLLLFPFGLSSWLLPLFIFLWSIRLFRHQVLDFRFIRLFGFIVLILAVSSLLAMLAKDVSWQQFSYGGLLGFILSRLAITYFGRLGAYIIFLTLAILSLALVLDMLVSAFFVKIAQKFESLIIKPLFKLTNLILTLKKRLKIKTKKPKLAAKEKFSLPKPESKPKISWQKAVSDKSGRQPVLQKVKSVSEPPEGSQKQEIKGYQLPSLDLLESPLPVAERKIKEDLAGLARILQETLSDFGVSVKITNIEHGPVITRYELEPAPGVKVNRIVSLADDIALAMKAQSVKVVAPIPGKGRVGVEIPNIQTSLVYLKEVLAAPEFQNSTSKLTLALGKDIAGRPVVADLAQMPHLLIAGTTGSGKTVCVNSLVLSLLYTATPDEVKLLMIDPKRVELAPFNELPHLLCPVITEAKKAAVALSWLVEQMEERYQLFAQKGKRNIEAYNESNEKIPYIVVIIDELADLMAVVQDEVEGAITRLAQLSRAVGIHLVLVTQRPSVDVITGVIKANFPARISFQVASKVDSRTVLDTNGAEKLLGRGDMLFLKPDESKLIRAQGSFVTDKEIERVVDFIKTQIEPVYEEEILKEQRRAPSTSKSKDELFEEAVRLIMETGQASVSILQRRLGLGYIRAARIIDTMEEEGLIGPFEGSKPRRILVDREGWLKENTLSKPKESIEKESR